PADVKGLKIRTPPDTMTVDIMQALGADTQQIKFAELYVALQQGVVDGQENPLANIASAKLYEVQKYLTFTGHKYEANPFVISKRTWDKLTPADQKLFTEAAAEATQLQRKLSKEADEKLAADLKAKGVQIETVDRKAFVEATKPVYAKWTAGPTGDFVKRVIQQAQQAH
ncbi:MAG TPA: TRAP transporter substrate-binding protein, partial [Albitalea sp.]|nr:TRAP transporter substrate-binding protein [Albitalea sp.]